MKKKFQRVDQSEINDFKRVCQNHGHNYAEFELHEHDVASHPVGDGLYYSRGKLTISRNGKTKIYNTGHGSQWVAEFDLDIIGFYS